MKEDEKKEFPNFKDVWTHIPTPKGVNDLNTISDWIKTIIEKIDGTERRILIVDDEQEVLHSLKEILEHEGFYIEVATNGIDALDLLSRKSFSIVLSDIRMPAMDGIELCEICKNHPQLSRIPIILFSGYYDTFESAADFFLEKPIDSESLLRVIQKIFDKYEIPEEKRKIGEKRKKSKQFQVISIEKLSKPAKIQKLLNFIWVFQPRKIPLFKLSHNTELTIENLRILLNIIEKHDTVVIVEDSPILRELLKAEIKFLGGNSGRIFDTLEQVKKNFDI